MPAPRSISFDRIAHRYDETRSLPEEQMEAIVDVFAEALQGYARVLEVGVGTGRMALPLRQRGVPIVGVDISAGMMARARKKGVRETLLADALHLPFREGAFDAAYSVHVLHLVADWARALEEVARVTRKAYFTVATHWEEGTTPFKVYWDALKAAGYERDLPGLFERKLPEARPPTARTPIGTFRETRRMAEAIERLEDRIYSGQWDVPTEVHAEAMAAVREAFAEEEYALERRVELLRWEVDALTP